MLPVAVGYQRPHGQQARSEPVEGIAQALYGRAVRHADVHKSLLPAGGNLLGVPPDVHKDLSKSAMVDFGYGHL